MNKIVLGVLMFAVVTSVAAQPPSPPLAARGETPAAFGRRCIPADCVAPPSNIPDILGRRALSAGRLAALGATLDFHHGLLRPPKRRRVLQSRPIDDFHRAVEDLAAVGRDSRGGSAHIANAELDLPVWRYVRPLRRLVRHAEFGQDALRSPALVSDTRRRSSCHVDGAYQAAT